MDKNTQKIVLIGTGNVAHQLGLAFIKTKIPICGVWGRSKTKSTELAKKLGASIIEDLHSLSSSNIALICVTDTGIEEVLDKIPKEVKVAYTSGSIGLSNLPKREALGVFYPLQTISKNRSIDFASVPFLIESQNTIFENELKILATQISSTVKIANSETRFQLHIAAVIVNNFVNHLYYLGEQQLLENNLSFDLLKPLIKETANKLDQLSPKEAQTGPAQRNDQLIIQKQLAAIKEKDTKEIYRLFSQMITAAQLKA